MAQFRPDLDTDDDQLADQLTDWLAHACTQYAKRTTEVQHVAINGATVELALRDGTVAIIGRLAEPTDDEGGDDEGGDQ